MSFIGRKRVVAGLITLIAVVAAAWWYTQRSDSTESAVSVAQASKQTVTQTVSGSGTLASARTAQLAFGVSGRISSVKVSAGDKVTKGQVLAELDTTALQARLASAKAQAQAAATTAAHDGSESLATQAANNANVAAMQADVAQAQANLDAATLTAPFSGTIASVNVAEGDQAGSAGAGGASPDGTSAEATGITLIKPRSFVVDVDIAASDIADVREGLQAQVSVTGAPDTLFGTVASVDKIATTSNSGAATFGVTVALTGKHSGLYVGTSADVSIIVKQRDNVLTVPTTAITTKDGKTYVTVVDGSKTSQVQVTVGEVVGASTEITDGLSEGDSVQITTQARPRGGAGGGSRPMPGGNFPMPGDFGGGAPPNFGGGPGSPGGFGGGR